MTVGFISAIMEIASQCLLPRAKFMKIMFYNLLSTCISAALCCLGLLSAVKARQHTTPLGGSVDEYNSSACVVSAVWLIFAIWFVFQLTHELHQAHCPQDIKHFSRLQAARTPGSHGCFCNLC
jgi:hypothetical protein